MASLDSDPESSLFDGKIQGLATPIYENERPLQGLAGLMDWRFGGVLSRAVKDGAFRGRSGECIYVPATRGGRTYHLLLVGGGELRPFGRRGLVPDESLRRLGRNLKGLKNIKIGLSQADFGNLTEEYFSSLMDGAPLWILP